MKKTLIVFIMLAWTMPVLAADGEISTGELMDRVAYGAVILVLIIIVVALLVLLKAIKITARAILKADGLTEAEIDAQMNPVKKVKPQKKDVWLKLLSLKPMSAENDILISHDYDGIQELDNPTPAWFMGLFYGTVAFGICYLLTYHVLGIGQLQYDEYKTEMAQADKAKAIYLSKAANRVDENTVKLVADPAVLSAGQTIFKANCAPCHGEHAQGLVGPNLTDDYWLHGSKINDLFKTIKYGVPAKGMPTWEKQLSPKQIADVANYVKSLHGTKLAGAKEPQGTKE